MERYWRQSYVIQLAAVFMMLLCLPLRWHAHDGSGLQIMGRALTSKIAFGLNPFDPDYLPISPWWIVWIIPMIGAGLGLRAANGLIFKQLTGQRKPVRLLGFLLCVGYGWYYATFTADLQRGFWLEVLSGGILLAALIVEMGLPRWSIEELRLQELPPDHPDRVTEGMYKICPTCGEFNDVEARQCRFCNGTLYPK